MAANRMENASATESSGAKPAENQASAPAAPTPAGGGLAAWLPLIVTLVAMPLLAYATTTFLLLPKLKQQAGAHPAAEATAEPAPSESKSSHGGSSESAAAEGKGGGSKEGGGKESEASKHRASLEKTLVNIKDTMGTRYLLTKMTLVGKPNIKKLVEENEEQLKDLAINVLSLKTITDLEKPDAKNTIRAELITQFNTALGSGAVQQIFFTEFTVQ